MSTNACGTTDLLLALGFAVFVPEGDGTLVPLGELPGWWMHIDPEGGRRAPCFRPSSRHVFLAHFLHEAGEFFESGRIGACDSGIWELEVDEDTRYCLQIRALRLNEESRVLIIQDLAASGIDVRQILQSGRDSHMRLLQDISQREQLERELRRAQGASERLNRAKTELLGKVSHEFRTPLTTILGMTELALAESSPEAIKPYLCEIEKAGRSLCRLVEDLLDTARMESGTISLRSDPFELKELVSGLAREASAKSAAKGLAFLAPEGFSWAARLALTGDSQRIGQILRNLLDNAIRYTSAGEVELRVGPHPADPESIRFQVRDTGPGIPEEEQPFLFEPFMRSRSMAEAGLEGTGLGLSIASKLATRMGGTISLESVLGAGTNFVVDLPLLRSPVIEVAASRASVNSPPDRGFHALRPVDGETSNVRPGPWTVLIAEDNVVNRSFVRHVLTKDGHQVLEAADGAEAARMAAEHDPDVLLMDCQMPHCDGLEGAARIREAERVRGGYLPIVAITASASQNDLERCGLAGMDGFLSKPYTIAQLREAIEAVIPRKIDSFGRL